MLVDGLANTAPSYLCKLEDDPHPHPHPQLKQNRCKHSIELAIMFNVYKIKDESSIITVGKRKTPDRPKKIRAARYHD